MLRLGGLLDKWYVFMVLLEDNAISGCGHAHEAIMHDGYQALNTQRLLSSQFSFWRTCSKATLVFSRRVAAAVSGTRYFGVHTQVISAGTAKEACGNEDGSVQAVLDSCLQHDRRVQQDDRGTNS